MTTESPTSEQKDAIRRTELAYPSLDERSLIHARVWLPEGVADEPEAENAQGPLTHEAPVSAEAASPRAPRAVVQIVHGMSEHGDRYDDFARWLAAQGYVVCAEDHIGHGKSAPTKEDLGVMPPNGKEILVADVHELRRAMQKRFPDVPYVLFGHSMGSFITRAYLARHGQGLAAAVICGTGSQPRAVSVGGNLLSRFLSAVRGKEYRSKLVDKLATGAFAKAVENPRTPYDWMTSDPEIIDEFIADDLTGQVFSVGAYATLTALTAEVVTKQSAARVPKDLPLLFVAGAQDPVGDYGKGVLEAADLYRRAGVRDVECVLYEGMRHEILNERGRMRVYEEVADWMSERLKRSREA